MHLEKKSLFESEKPSLYPHGITFLTFYTAYLVSYIFQILAHQQFLACAQDKKALLFAITNAWENWLGLRSTSVNRRALSRRNPIAYNQLFCGMYKGKEKPQINTTASSAERREGAVTQLLIAYRPMISKKRLGQQNYQTSIFIQ